MFFKKSFTSCVCCDLLLCFFNITSHNQIVILFLKWFFLFFILLKLSRGGWSANFFFRIKGPFFRWTSRYNYTSIILFLHILAKKYQVDENLGVTLCYLACVYNDWSEFARKWIFYNIYMFIWEVYLLLGFVHNFCNIG